MASFLISDFRSVRRRSLSNVCASVLPAHLTLCPGTLVDADSIADVLARSFHPPDGLERMFFPFRRFGIAEDLRQRLRDKSACYCCLVAWIGSQPVGTLEISLRRLPHLPEQARRSKQPYISNLAVHPNWRQRGIGRQLLIGAEGVVQAWGFGILHLHVLEGNRPARALYHSLDYRVVHINSDPWSWLGFPKQLLLYKPL